jgi:hypothetical protein
MLNCPERTRAFHSNADDRSAGEKSLSQECRYSKNTINRIILPVKSRLRSCAQRAIKDRLRPIGI